MTEPARIFVSYSHQDDALREELRSHVAWMKSGQEQRTSEGITLAV